MSGPFGEMALDVMGSGIGDPLPLKEGTKRPVVAGYHGGVGKDTKPVTAGVVDKWVGNSYGALGIGVRLHETVVGIDVDAHDGKPGAETLAGLEGRLGVLPATWTTTARKSPNGIRLFRVPRGTVVDAHDPGPGIDLISRWYRLIVVEPSINPRNGETYRWYGPTGERASLPSIDDLPDLPSTWLEHLQHPNGVDAEMFGTPSGAVYPSDESAVELLEAVLVGGQPLPTGKGSRHILAASVVQRLVNNGRHTLLQRAEQAWMAVMPGERPGGEGEARREWGSFVSSAEKKHAVEAKAATGLAAGGAPVEPGGAIQGTDTSNAALLIDLHGGTIRYVREWQRWIVWDEYRWRLDPKGVAVGELAKDVSQHLIDEAAREMRNLAPEEFKAKARWAKQSANKTRIGYMTDLARGDAVVLIEHDVLDANPWALNVENGWVDLQDGSFHSADPGQLNMMVAPVRFDPAAAAPLWRAAMSQWHPDEEQRKYVQRLAGAAVAGVVREHVLVIHYGGGGNGKGTFVGALANVLGPYFVVPHRSLVVSGAREEHQTVVAALFRARLAVASETDSRVKLSEANVKNLTGGDKLSARRMREDPWSFDPTHTLWLQTNFLPEITGVDDGIWRRIRVVPWVNTFTGGDEDVALGEELRDEAAGILNWLIKGTQMWLEDGLAEPKTVLEETIRYRKSEDVIEAFIAENDLVLGEEQAIKGGDLMAKWGRWTEETYGRSRPTKELVSGLEMKGIRKPSGPSRRNKVLARWWVGIGLKSPFAEKVGG